MPDETPSSRDLLQSALQRTADCPPLETLEQALDGDPAMTAHAHSCAYCRTELELLESFRLAEIPSEDARAVDAVTRRLSRHSVTDSRRVPEPRQRWWQFSNAWLRPAALATAGLLVLIAIGLQLRHSSAPALRNTQANGAEVFRSNSLAVLSPSGDLQKSPGEVRWEPVPSAAGYQIRLLEVDGNELWSAQTTDTSIAFPPSVRARFVPTKTLLISVTAFDGKSHKIAESAIVRFRILQNLYPH
jgi:hypothetical protein